MSLVSKYAPPCDICGAPSFAALSWGIRCYAHLSPELRSANPNANQSVEQGYQEHEPAAGLTTSGTRHRGSNRSSPDCRPLVGAYTLAGGGSEEPALLTEAAPRPNDAGDANVVHDQRTSAGGHNIRAESRGIEDASDNFCKPGQVRPASTFSLDDVLQQMAMRRHIGPDDYLFLPGDFGEGQAPDGTYLARSVTLDLSRVTDAAFAASFELYRRGAR